MNLREAYRHTVAHFTAGNAVAWISPPGMGKSDSVKKLLAWMKKTFPGQRLGVSIIFMATQSPIGFTGLPWKGALEYGGKQYTITDPAIAQWALAIDLDTGELAPVDQFHRVLLVIEEWGQGDLDTKRAGAELLLHGACGKWRLPPGSFRLALSNNDVRDGITKEFDFVINRRAQLNIQGDVDVWLEDFADKPQYDGKTVMPVTKVWAKNNSHVLFEAKPKDQGPWCTPRSATMWDRYAQAMAEMNGGNIPLDDPGFVEGTAGMVGMAAGQTIFTTCRFQLELPPYADVVTNPDGTDIPTKIDHLMLQMYELAQRAKEEHVGALLQYIGRVKQQDMHITFVTALLRRDFKFVDHPAMKTWITKNARLVATVGALSQ